MRPFETEPLQHVRCARRCTGKKIEGRADPEEHHARSERAHGCEPTLLLRSAEPDPHDARWHAIRAPIHKRLPCGDGVAGREGFDRWARTYRSHAAALRERLGAVGHTADEAVYAVAL